MRRLTLVVVAMALAGCSSGPHRAVATPVISTGPTIESTSPTTTTTAVAVTTTPTDVPHTDAGSTTTTPWTGPCGVSSPVPARYDHVIWIWMENKNRGTVFDSTHSPFMHDLAAACASASNYVDHGIHPSLANYIAATSGDTHGIADDAAPAKHPLDVDNVFRQVRAVGSSSRSYQEAMPGNCALTSTRRYAVKHNPAAYYIGADDRQACQRDDVPFDQFAADLNGPVDRFPAFALITPDICNDMHDCPVATGDAWLRGTVEPILSSALYRAGRTAVFVVFDESQGRGTLPFIAIAPTVAPGSVATAELDHFALLRFTEDVLGLGAHLGRAETAADLRAAITGL